MSVTTRIESVIGLDMPTRTDPDTFEDRTNVLLNKFPTLGQELNDMAEEFNSTVSTVSDSSDLAEKWASEVEDTEVETGKYSALHHAAKAEASATSVADAASTATTQAGIATTQAGIATTQAGLATDAYDDFSTHYSSSATEPDPPTRLWYDETTDLLKVYNGSAYVEAGTSVNGTTTRELYVATADQTTFDVVYDIGYVDVWVNGFKLPSTDITATNGTSVVLPACDVGDIVDIVAYGAFTLADHYTQSAADARFAPIAHVTTSATDSATGHVELATQAEAEAGTASNVVMTPERTKQAIAALSSSILQNQIFG